MKPFLTAFLLLSAFLSGAQIAPDWNPTPTPSSGTMLGQATLDGYPCEEGDWVGGFTDAGLCVGASLLILDNGTAYIQLALYGDDATTAETDGLTPGESFSLHLWDASENTVYILETPVSGWVTTNGAPIPGLDSPDTLYAFGGPRQGCMDPGYFEFDPLAEVDDGSCATLIVPGCTDPAFLEFD